MKVWKSLFFLFVFALLLVGCDTKEKGKSPVNSPDSSAEEDQKQKESASNVNIFNYDDKQLAETEKFISMNIDELLPVTNYIVQSESVFLCHYMSMDEFLAYQEKLEEKGFALSLEENTQYQRYYYIGESTTIEIVKLSEVTLISINPYDQENNLYKQGLSSEEALSIIQKQEEIVWDNMDKTENPIRTKPAIVLKRWIPQLYEKTQMEVYATFTSEGKESGTYIVRGESAYRVHDSLDRTCIADIDQDGNYELLSLYGFGSGIYRIHLNVYEYGNPRLFSSLAELVYLKYSNCYVPNAGYGQLKFHQIDDATVHLMEDETDGRDYGKLMIEADGYHINPENMAEFPYYQWDIDYNPQNISSNIDIQKNLSEIPELTVKIGDTIIENQGRKVDWNGETEDKVTFSSLMKDDIPAFKSPSILGEQQDEICLSFSQDKPTSVKVSDYLINEKGAQIYDNKANIIEQDIRYGKDGNYYVPLTVHWALLISSSISTYTNPSYRGYRVECKFGDKQTCEYTFVLSTEPMDTVK